MICEFALDPALVARWHDPREWAFFREAFSPDTGRMGSAYPRKWRKDVIRTFHDLVPGVTAQSQPRRRLDELLDRLGEQMVERESSHAECPTWLEKAMAEHRERPFNGILSNTRVAKEPAVITPDMLFSDHPPGVWSAPSNPTPPRTVDGFAQAVAPLLTRCREAVFVDPWFSPGEERFREPLRAMLTVLWGPACCVSSPKAQLVIAERGKQGKRDGNWLLGQCQGKLSRILPTGRSLQVTVLRQRDGGEKVHNCYILTLLAGVSFGTGLDVADDGDAGQSDDLCRLSREQLLKRWGQYVSARGSWFDIAAGPTMISSSR